MGVSVLPLCLHGDNVYVRMLVCLSVSVCNHVCVRERTRSQVFSCGWEREYPYICVLHVPVCTSWHLCELAYVCVCVCHCQSVSKRLGCVILTRRLHRSSSVVLFSSSSFLSRLISCVSLFVSSVLVWTKQRMETRQKREWQVGHDPTPAFLLAALVAYSSFFTVYLCHSFIIIVLQSLKRKKNAKEIEFNDGHMCNIFSFDK